MPKKVIMKGNEAVALAMRQINPNVVAAYPITPQTEIVQIFSSFVSDELVDTEFVTVESEHSAMSASIGASAAGARAMTATSANGLAFMWEVIYIAASLRLPIVMAVVNRALSGPINIHCDHSDSMGARDSGWIQIYSENAQEAYDNMIQGIRIAEHEDLKLPVMVTMDGFIISHAMENLMVLEDDKVEDFIGEYKPQYPLLDIENPVTYGPLDLYDFYFEHKRQQAEAMRIAGRIIKNVADDYEKLSGRSYGLVEPYYLEDAKVALVVLGSTAGTAKACVDELRLEGKKVGLLKIRVFRPFPYDEIIEALKGLKVVAIMDRSDSFSSFGGPVFNEVRSAILSLERPPITLSYIYGLGGRDVNLKDILGLYHDLEEIVFSGEPGEVLRYLGVRES